MKKIFNYLLMSLVVVTLSMGFVACSSDDDESENGSKPTVTKKLASVRFFSERRNEDNTYRPVYDSEGHLIEITVNGQHKNYMTFTWSGNSFVNEGETYTLKDGKISQSSYRTGNTIYTYDANGRPKYAYYSYIDGGYSVSYNYTITNDRFTRYILQSSGFTRDYSYTYSSTQKGYGVHVLFCDFIHCGPQEYTFFHPEIFGMENITDMPDTMKMAEDGTVVVYDVTYDVDEDGYITCIKMTPPISSYTDYTYYLKWE